MITQKSLRDDRSQSQFLNILLAEDNAVNQKLAVRLLEKRGHTVKVVDNGREAFDAVQKTRFDLVLMDVQMPEMDGITATTLIREKELVSGEHQPIVAMTALVMKGDRERCLAAKMDGYLSKPIRGQELDEVLEIYTARKREACSDKEQAQDTIETGFAGAAINLEELMERIDGDLEFIGELSEIFKDDYPRQIATVRGCLEGGDLEGLKRAAHGLKGALANLSATYAASLAASLERSAAGGEMEGLKQTLVELERELPRVLDALAGHRREYAI